jgi:hypothetical protein
MSKDKENCNTIKTGVTEILKKGYSLLDSNIRKQMGEMLDDIFIVTQGWVHWKNRYLYPNRNIPKKNFDEYSKAMLDTLNWGLQEQVDVYTGKIDLVDEKIRHLHLEKEAKEAIVKEIMEIVNTYTNEQKG